MGLVLVLVLVDALTLGVRPERWLRWHRRGRGFTRRPIRKKPGRHGRVIHYTNVRPFYRNKNDAWTAPFPMSPYREKLPGPAHDIDAGSRSLSRFWLKSAGAVFLLAWVFLCATSRWRHLDWEWNQPDGFPKVPKEFPINIPVPLELQRNWGAYTPWFPVAEYRPAPEYCDITQVCFLALSQPF